MQNEFMIFLPLSRKLPILLFVPLFVIFGSIAVAQAQEMTQYQDVPAGVWFEDHAASLLVKGALDDSRQYLNPEDLATRAEVVKMLAEVYDAQLSHPPEETFDDVSRNAWYFPYFETAARNGWIRGDDNCADTARGPCMARPTDGINRAEVSALLKRAFSLQYRGTAPEFSDNQNPSRWYYTPVQTAADFCVLQGDDFSSRVRPAFLMNRAEMVAIFHRASQHLSYLNDCSPGDVVPGIRSISYLNANTIRIRFLKDVDEQRAEQPNAYVVARRADLAPMVVDSVRLVDSDTVEVELGQQLTSDAWHTLTVLDLHTAEDSTFSDSHAWFSGGGGAVSVTSVTAETATRLNVLFSADVMREYLVDEDRYTLVRISNGAEILVERAVWNSDQSADLILNSSLVDDAQYELTARSMRAEQGFTFSDSFAFTADVAAPTEGDLTSVDAESSTQLALSFNTALDAQVAEDVDRYVVDSSDDTMDVANAILTTETTIVLSLSRAMRTQERFAVSVSGLRTRGGDVFSDSGNFTYAPDTVSFDTVMDGTRENPPAVTTASGTGSFTLTADGLEYDIYIYGLSGAIITGSHFHRGDPNENGPVLQGFSVQNNHRATGTWAGLTMRERDDLLEENVYVNVHTEAYPDGEIRGQVLWE